MTKREGRRYAMVPYTSYTAEDGREFATEQDCLFYEEQLKRYMKMIGPEVFCDFRIRSFFTGTAESRFYLFRPTDNEWKNTLDTVLQADTLQYAREVVPGNEYLLLRGGSLAIVMDIKSLRKQMAMTVRHLLHGIDEAHRAETEENYDALPF